MSLNLSDITKEKYLEACLIRELVEAESRWDSRTGPAIVTTPLATERSSLSTKDAARHIGYGRTKFKAMAKDDPTFPKPFGNPLRPKWKVVELDKWLARQKQRA